MATEIVINGTLILDQSSGIQDDDDPIGGDLSGLSAAFIAFLNNLTTVSANTLSASQLSFAGDVEAVVSSANFVTVTPNSATVTNLFFSDAAGNDLDGDQVFQSDGVTPLTTVAGDSIYLWSFGDFVIATTSNDPDAKGDVVAAFYLNEAADDLSASIEMVTFIPIAHPDGTDSDDRIDWTDILNVSAATTLAFDFADLPSNQSLFGLIAADKTELGPDDLGLAVVPMGATLNADGSYITGGANKSQTINTSKGGGPVTIGGANQLYDNPGEGAFFVYITDPDDDAVAGVGSNLSTRYDDADNLGFGSTFGGVESASYEIVQNSTSSKSRVTAYDIDPGRVGDPTTDQNVVTSSRDFILDPTAGADLVSVTAVRVYDQAGNLLESVLNVGGVAELQDITGDGLVTAADNNSTVVITFVLNSDGVTYSADTAISKKDSKYTVEFDTDGPHNMALVSWAAGQFDIGGFNLAQGLVVTEPVGDKLFVDDDGPNATLATTAATVVMDETDNDGDDSGTGGALADVTTAISTLFSDTSAFGTDDGKDSNDDGTVDTDATTYSLVLNAANGAASGLVDTLSGDAIFLFKEGDDIVGRVGNDDGAANAAGAIAFIISVTNDPDNVRVVLNRAVVHDDPTDPDESDTPKSITADLVLLRVEIVDDDTDKSFATAELGSRIGFEDDGPSITRNATAAPTLTTDDTDITDTAGPTDFSGLFDAAFGSDGFKDADDDDIQDADAITYALGVKSPGADSGLRDTLTNNKIFLFLQGGVVNGRVGNNDGTANSAGAVVFSVSVIANTGLVTLDQFRAIVHDDPSDPVESGASAAGLAAADLVTLTATATDGDLDTASATADIGDAFKFEDDGPAITAQIASGAVDFANGDSATNSLNGDVGSDQNAINDQASDGTKTHTFDSATIVSTSIDDLKVQLSADKTTAWFFTDGAGGTADQFDAGIDTLWFSNVLSQSANAGAGSYTFTVHQPPPAQFVEFDFTDLPANQSLFGLIAADKSQLGPDDLGLAVVPLGATLNADGTYITGGANKSNTINTSKGGGPVTIASSNQLFDKAGEGGYFIYITDPDDDAVAGVGTNLSTGYDDADNLGFDGTREIETASYEIVQNSTASKSRVTAYDIDPGRVGNPTNDQNVDTNSRAFVLDPTATDDLVSVTAVRVYDQAGNLLESVVNNGGIAVLQDITGDGLVTAADNNSTVAITFVLNSDGATYSADTAISKKDSKYTVEFDTAAPHDMALVSWVAGTFDIGGFNFAEGQDTPDQLFDFSVKVTDFDLDKDGDQVADVFDDFSVTVDGTGAFDDPLVG